MTLHHAGHGSITHAHLEAWLASPAYRVMSSRYPDATQQALLKVLELLRHGLDPMAAHPERERQARIGGYLRKSRRRMAYRAASKHQRLETAILATGHREDFWGRTPLDPEREYRAREALAGLGLSPEEVAFLVPDELPAPEDDELAAKLGVSINAVQQRRSRQTRFLRSREKK